MTLDEEMFREIMSKILKDVAEFGEDSNGKKDSFYLGQHLAFYKVLIDIDSVLTEWFPTETDEEQKEIKKNLGFDIDIDAYLKNG